MRTARGFELRADGVGVLQLQPTEHARNMLNETGFTSATRCRGATWSADVYGAYADMRLASVAYDDVTGHWRFVTRQPPATVIRAGMPRRPELWQLQAALGERLRWLLMGGCYAVTAPMQFSR